MLPGQFYCTYFDEFKQTIHIFLYIDHFQDSDIIYIAIEIKCCPDISMVYILMDPRKGDTHPSIFRISNLSDIIYIASPIHGIKTKRIGAEIQDTEFNTKRTLKESTPSRGSRGKFVTASMH